MVVDSRKTEEMRIRLISKACPPPATVNGTVIERVTTFKLLGFHVSDGLKWLQHVQMICAQLLSRLDLLFKTTETCVALEYAVHMWLSGLSAKPASA